MLMSPNRSRVLNILSTILCVLTNYRVRRVASLSQVISPTYRSFFTNQYRRTPSLSLSFYHSPYSTSTIVLSMRGRKKGNDNNKAMGKTIAKENLPSKVCVVCNRPFTWRKKWERVWDEVTTCSKSCNAKRRSTNKKDNSETKDDNNAVNTVPSSRREQVINSIISDDEDNNSISSSSSLNERKTAKALARKEHKKAIKQMKAERKLKRSGQADPSQYRKPCDVCTKNVDLLIRCTVDETLQYKMVCGNCWKDVSGGVVDGDVKHPYYNYGGLWKNRYAKLKKRIGDGSDVGIIQSEELDVDENILALLE